MDSSNRDRSLHFRKLGQRKLCVALPADHPLADSPSLAPRQISGETQVIFDYDTENSFGQWASGGAEERVICKVNTAQVALELVAEKAGLCVMPADCAQLRADVRFVPLENWSQALYMCILYDKWLEPPVWDFVEILVKAIRQKEKETPDSAT